MDKMWFKARRLISMLLVVAMLTSVMPVQAFAEEGTDPAAVSTTSEAVTENESAAAEAEAAAKAAEEEAAAKAAEEAAAQKAAEEAAAQKAAEEAAAQKAAEEAAAQKAAEEAAAQKAAEEAAAQKAAEEAAAQKAAEEAAAQKAAEEAAAQKAAEEAAAQKAAEEAAAQKAAEEAAAAAGTEKTDPAAETEKPAEEKAPAEEMPAEGAPAEEAAQPVAGEAQQEPAEEEPVLVGYTVRYLDKATEASVYEDTTGEAAVGETITITAPTVEGYTLCADQPAELVLAADTENTATLYYEETMPAQTLTATAADGATVTINAPQGALPAGTTVQIVKMDTVPEVAGVEYTQAVAYDVTLWKDNAEVQPAVAVSVTLSNVPLAAESDSLEAYHFADDGTVDEGSVQADKSADFSLSSFSPVALYDIAGDVEDGAGDSGNPGVETYGLNGYHKPNPEYEHVEVEVGKSIWLSDLCRIISVEDESIAVWTVDIWGNAFVQGKSAGTTKAVVYDWFGRAKYYEIEVTDSGQPDTGNGVPVYFYILKPTEEYDPENTNVWQYAGEGTANLPNPVPELGNHRKPVSAITQYPSVYPQLQDEDDNVYTYNPNGGDNTYTIEWMYAVCKAGATFGGVRPDIGSDTYTWHVDGVAILHKANKYQVNFMVKKPDGTVENVSPFLQDKGEPVGNSPAMAPKEYNNEMYSFDGWYRTPNYSGTQITDFTNVYPEDGEDSITFYGQYTKETQEYTINYQVKGEGGSVTTPTETVKKNENAEGSEAIPSKDFYFVRWEDADGKTVSTEELYAPTNVQGDATYYAVFEKKTELTITIQNKETTYDGTEQSGYGFMDSGEGKSTVTGLKNSDSVESITGYTAAAGTNVYTAYTGTVDENPTAVVQDASGKDVSEQYTVKINPGTLTIKGKVTYDWNTNDSVFAGVGSDQTVDLPVDNDSYAFGETIPVTSFEQQPVHGDGYVFVGWSKNKTATEPDTEFKMGTASMTLYAVWSKRTLEVPVQYYMDNAPVTNPGTGYPQTVSATYGENITVAVGGTGSNLNLPLTMTSTDNETSVTYVLKKVVADNKTIIEHTNANHEQFVQAALSGTVSAVTDATVIQVYYVKDSDNNNKPDSEQLTVKIEDRTVTYNGTQQYGYDPAGSTDQGTAAMTAVLGDGTALTYTVTVTGYVRPSGTRATQSPITVENNANARVTVKDGDKDITANYYIDFVPGTLTINPIATRIDVIASSADKNYDGDLLTDETYQVYSLDSLAPGDHLEVQITGMIRDVGSTTNEVTSCKVLNAKGEDVTDCYNNIVTADGKLVIYARPITITAKDAYKVEGQNDPATWEVDIVGDEGLSAKADSLESAYTVRRAPGEEPDDYEITVALTENASKNYTITVNPGTFTIFADQKGGQDGGKDGIPDEFQTIFQYVSAGNGTVSGTVYEVHTAADWQKNWQTATKPVVHPDASVDVTPAAGYVFSNFTGSDGKTYAGLDAIRALETDQDMVFTANFTAAPVVVGNLSYTVRYLEDNTARELASPKTVGGQTLGASVTEYAPDIAGYSLMSNANPQTITIGTGDNIITFYYRAVGAATEPTPTPTENPAPVVLPATPTTPTTPAAPAAPAGPTVTAAPEEEVEAPAEEEEVPEEETPLAPEAGEEESIGEEETPLAGGNAAWALLNLILTILTVLGSLILLIGYLGKKRKEDEEGNEEYTVKKHGFWRVASLVPAIGAIIAFILTEDMSQPMVFVDRWTLLMVIIAVIQIVVAVLSMKDKQEPDEDDAANA